MSKTDRQNWRSGAAEALRKASYSPKKLALIHTAASAGLALAIAALNYLLSEQIAGTGGLAGIGNRAMLETFQSLLEMANVLLLPFWQMGLIFAFLSVSRREAAGPRDLLAGFTRFGPIFRGKVLQIVSLTGTAFIGCYLGSMVFSFTPMSQPLYEAVEPFLAEGVIDYTVLMADKAVMASLLYSLPFMVGAMALLTVPLYYRLRMMDYILLDQPQKGAFYALRMSKMIMRGKRMALFKLDLSFWWFYVLELLITVVCYGDMLLPALGIDLGMSADAAFFAFYAVALVGQIGLYTWKKPLLLTTYARFYEDTLPRETPAQ